MPLDILTMLKNVYAEHEWPLKCLVTRTDIEAMMQRCGCQYAHESFSTDSKLLNKVIDFCHGVADKESLKVRQIYVRELRTKARSTFQGQEDQQDRSQEGR